MHSSCLSVLVTCCCITNYSPTYRFTQHAVMIAPFCGSGREGLTWAPDSRVSYRTTIRMFTGYSLIQRLGPGRIHFYIHAHGYWQDSVLHGLLVPGVSFSSSPHGLLHETTHNRAADFIRVSKRESRRGKPGSLCNLLSETEFHSVAVIYSSETRY